MNVVRLLKSLSLSFKLTLAFLVVALIASALLAVFARQATQSAFGQFVLEQGLTNFVDNVTAYYTSEGSWNGIDQYLRRLPRGAAPQGPQANNSRFPQGGLPGRQPFLLIDASGAVVWPAGPYHVGDHVPGDELARGTQVKVNGQVAGTVLTTAVAPELDPREQQYLDRTNQALLKAALGATAAAVLLGFLLARTLTTPVRELTSAIRAIAKGKLNQAVPVRTHDELGELAVAFNQMSADLARSNDLRRQMTADIAHDLRTPLSVVTGYIESLRDGVLKPTPERLNVLYREAQHLNRLVDDLRTLSLADAHELQITRQVVQPRELLDRLGDAYRHQAEQRNIILEVQAEDDLPGIFVDAERMAQVLANLVSNALRYTPSGGWITLGGRREPATGDVLLVVQDNGAGIPPDSLPHIFERFYRADSARTQSTGESGLGLAIAKSIVEIHGGKISAASPGPAHGSTFTIRLPAHH